MRDNAMSLQINPMHHRQPRAKMCCTEKIMLIAILVCCVIQLSLTGGLFGYIDSVDADNPTFDALAEAAQFINTAHYPLPYEEYDRPDQGACCNALCAGDTCFAGTAYTLDSRSCNRCCAHLIAPASCVGHECACYANSQ